MAKVTHPPFKIDKDDKRRLNELAKQTNSNNVSEEIRIAIKERLNKHKIK